MQFFLCAPVTYMIYFHLDGVTVEGSSEWCNVQKSIYVNLSINLLDFIYCH